MAQISIAVDHFSLRRCADGKQQDGIAKIHQMADTGRIQFVTSLIHMYEIAKHSDHASNLREARLIDSLRPKWLHWRLDLIAQELLNLFHCWRGEQHLERAIDPFVVSPSQQLPGGKIRLIERDASSAEGIVTWLQGDSRRYQEIRDAEAFTKYRDTLKRLSEARATDPDFFNAIRVKATKGLVSQLAPERDWNGNFTLVKERKDFVEQVNPRDSPTLATELALQEFRTRRPFLPEASEEWDLQFATAALPYVDVTIFDRQFCDLVRQAARTCRAIKSRYFADLSKAIEYTEQV